MDDDDSAADDDIDDDADGVRNNVWMKLFTQKCELKCS